MSINTLEPLEPGKYYHIYNHANGNDNIFKTDANYLFFLKRYAFHVAPVADTFAYCLMPNHFHLAVRIKSAAELANLQGLEDLEGLSALSDHLGQQFSNLFNSYSKAFNKQQNRRGALFVPRFRRKHIDNDSYFRELIHYIHFNPVHHGFVKDLREWKYTSFESFFSEKASLLRRDEVISWFLNRENFLSFHQQQIDGKMVLELEF